MFPTMLSAISLVFSPGPTWERIALANRGVFWVLFLYVIPCMLLGFGIEYYGLTHFGDIRSGFDSRTIIPPETATKYLLLHVAAGLLTITLGAWFLTSVARSSHVPSNYSQAFNALGYATGPLFLLHALDAAPGLNTWIPWAIGAFLAASLLYHGVALCLKPEQTKGFGLFVFSVILVLVLSGLARFVGVLVLNGRVWKDPLPGFAMLF